MAPLGFDDLADQIHENEKFAFGEEIVYLPKAGGSFSIIGIFNTIFEQVDPDTERVVASNNPTLGIKLSDIPNAPRKGDKVNLPSRNLFFRVHDSQEDGEGMTELHLHRIDE